MLEKPSDVWGWPWDLVSVSLPGSNALRDTEPVLREDWYACCVSIPLIYSRHCTQLLILPSTQAQLQNSPQQPCRHSLQTDESHLIPSLDESHHIPKAPNGQDQYPDHPDLANTRDKSITDVH